MFAHERVPFDSGDHDYGASIGLDFGGNPDRIEIIYSYILHLERADFGWIVRVEQPMYYCYDPICEKIMVQLKNNIDLLLQSGTKEKYIMSINVGDFVQFIVTLYENEDWAMIVAIPEGSTGVVLPYENFCNPHPLNPNIYEEWFIRCVIAYQKELKQKFYSGECCLVKIISIAETDDGSPATTYQGELCPINTKHLRVIPRENAVL